MFFFKSPRICLELNSRSLGHDSSALTTRLIPQVRMESVKVCAQQSMSNDLQFGSEFCQFGKKTSPMTSKLMLSQNLILTI